MDSIQAAREYAVSELEKFGSPLPLHFEISEKKGIELAEKLVADIVVVRMGVYFMDLKIGQALKENRLQEHIRMSVDAAKEFFATHPFDEDSQRKIINCIEAHHADVPFSCIEAEICANADCYRFLHPRGFFSYLILSGKRGSNLSDCLKFAEEKMDEKHRILSLDICKKELDGYYSTLKQFISDARSF
jgi:hypothetical protein